jgi:hypothetical protein
MMYKNFRFSLFAVVVLMSSHSYASCGSAFCMLNTNWSAQGVWMEPGARLDLRYEYIDQDQLRSGTRSANADEIAEMDHREIGTTNNNLQAAFEYAFNETYGISVNAPLFSRKHTHLHVNPDDATDTEKEEWSFTKLGDVRVVGRMQLSPATNLHEAFGINLGIKLPTGDYQIANDEGELAERSMQPGTGTTDAIAGVYYHQQLPSMKSQWFTQLQATKPLNKRDEYQAGNQISWDLGYRYGFTQNTNFMAQLNYVVKGRDSGAQAEPEESGSKTLSFSPGLSFTFNKTSQLYTFLHHRLYQDVNGVQLSSKDSIVVGISTRF